MALPIKAKQMMHWWYYSGIISLCLFYDPAHSIQLFHAFLLKNFLRTFTACTAPVTPGSTCRSVDSWCKSWHWSHIVNVKALVHCVDWPLVICVRLIFWFLVFVHLASVTAMCTIDHHEPSRTEKTFGTHSLQHSRGCYYICWRNRQLYGGPQVWCFWINGAGVGAAARQNFQLWY